MASARELLDSAVSTFNTANWDAYLAMYTPNGVYEEIGTGRRLTPAEAVAAGKAWKSAFPDGRGVVENAVVAGNQAIGEIVWSGTNSGSLNGMPATGKSIQVRAVIAVMEEGGRASRVRQYIDVAGMLTALGVMPAAPAASR